MSAPRSEILSCYALERLHAAIDGAIKSVKLEEAPALFDTTKVFNEIIETTRKEEKNS